MYRILFLTLFLCSFELIKFSKYLSGCVRICHDSINMSFYVMAMYTTASSQCTLHSMCDTMQVRQISMITYRAAVV